MIFTDVQTVSRVHITPFYQSIKRNKLEIQKVPQGQYKKKWMLVTKMTKPVTNIF